MTCLYQSFRKRVRFRDLIESVQHCDLCPRLCERTKVLSDANGSIDSKVLFIAEAPGRLGADRTGIPLYGDKTGNNFENLLSNVGWKRSEVFVTNAVLCNPREHDGTNGTPTRDEISNCLAYLEMTISLVKPDVIVSLGATALEALDLLSPHGLRLQEAVGTFVPWSGVKLFPLYHPGPRALVHRSLPKQRSDFICLSKVVHPVNGSVVRKKTKVKPLNLAVTDASPMQQVACVLLELGGRMTHFKMTKLMYLIDFFALEKLGCMVASNIYLREADGPWAPDLNKALEAMKGYEVRKFILRGIPIVAPGPSPRFEIQLDDHILEMISSVFRTYGPMTNAQIKAAVYRTDPMRFILQEENRGKCMVNKPVLYRNKSARELCEQES